MSKINAVRIVNLNYNKNTMKVNDETFEFGGESTLMSLRNGGGKTVMVQMMMAPFVNARYRDLKDRKFENYFTSQTPTYILTEWLLDNNSSYVLFWSGWASRGGMFHLRKTSGMIWIYSHLSMNIRKGTNMIYTAFL